MVDKINGNSSYDYPGQNDARKSPALQAYENTPGKKEAAKQKSSSTRNTRGRTQEAAKEQRGVILDLSSSKDSKEPSAKQRTSWLTALRKIVTPVIAWIKNFWESDAVAAETEAEAAHLDLEPADADTAVMAGLAGDLAEDIEALPPLDEVNEIPDYESMLDNALKSHDLQKMEQLLTQNGTKHLAHHSDLLTYYDRRGKLVEMDDTAKHRVLFGDKNIFKL